MQNAAATGGLRGGTRRSCAMLVRRRGNRLRELRAAHLPLLRRRRFFLPVAACSDQAITGAATGVRFESLATRAASKATRVWGYGCAGSEMRDGRR